MDKVTFLPRLQRERDQFEMILNQVGFARQMTMKGVWEDLSIKDLLADILTREQFIADRLSEIQHGESYTPSQTNRAFDSFHKLFGYPDYESPLAEKEKPDHLITYKYKNIALDDIVEQEISAYAGIIQTLEKLTHEQCLEHNVFLRVAEHTYKPYRRLIHRINRWRESISPETK